MLRILILCLFIALTQCTSTSTSHPSVLRVNLYCEPPTLDPRLATDSTSMNVLVMLFEGLTRIGKDHRPHPALAKHIKISPDHKTYTFTLRPSFWSDGTALTADDIAYAWQSILTPNFPSPFAYKLYIIENAEAIKTGKLPMDRLGVKALDSNKLEVRLENPTPYFLELLASPTFFPVQQKLDQANENWSYHARSYVSNGPFSLKTWEHENEIVVKKNPLYWDEKAVQLQNLHLSMIEDNTTEFYMYEMNELDWAGSPLSNISADILPALKRQGLVISIPATGIYYFKINTEHFPLNNPSIRRALAFAIDRKSICEHVTQAGQVPAMGMIPPMDEWGAPSRLFDDHDVRRAKQEFEKGLKELGLSKATFPRLILSHNINYEHHKIAQALQQQWQQTLGIDVEIEQYDWKVYLSKINKQDYQIGRMGWLGEFCDPFTFLEPFKTRDDPVTGGINGTGWENPRYVALLTEAQREKNREKRKILMREAEALLIDEMPVIPLYFLIFSYMKKPYVKDVYISPLGIADFKYAKIK